MKALLLLVAIVLLSSVSVAGQSRTAERIVSVPFSQLDPTGNLPDGSVRYVLNGQPGTTPCTSGGTGSFAMKVAGQWQCGKLTPGIGTGDVLGTTASTPGEVVLFSSTNGRAIGRSNTLNGILLVSSGVASALASTGTGGVVRDATPTINTPVLVTPTIASFASAQHTHETAAGAGQLNATNVFSSGTIPTARIVTGAATISRCLRVNNLGQIAVAAADCGAGGGGAPGGSSGNLQVNEAGAFGALSNTMYDSPTGRLTFTQKANGNDTLNILRFTDTSPTGTLLRVRDAANATDLFAVNANGSVFAVSTLTIKNTAAPALPSAGNSVLWTDSTGKNLQVQDDAGNVSSTVRAVACSGTDKISAISSAGVVTCTSDQTTPGGSGITTLNTLTATSQSFAVVDDTNVTLTITPATSVHTFTLGWTGRLDAARMDINTVLNDAANTWTTGAQSFAAAASLTVPSAAGAAPTASGLIAYDTTSNTLEAGINGANRTVAFTASSQTLSDKTLDNSNTLNIRDTLLTLQDNSDPTKTANFELSAIGSGANRTVSLPNANSVTVIPTTATANQFVTHIDSAGVVQKAQPSFANLSGSLGPTQGGTGQTAVAQGDLLFGDAANSWARLAKSASATRYLSNTGASNNPAWAQVDLTNGVIGLLPVGNWSPLTTKGDLLTFTTTTVRLGVGTDGFALVADSTQAAGIKWAAVTASAGGSTTQLQRNNAGVLGGISGATSDGTNVTFGAGNIIIGSAASITPALGKLYVDSDDNKLYFGIDGSTVGEVFVSGLSAVNLASANVTGTLPLANGGTNQTSWTAARCVRVNAGGTALEAAAADCGSGGSGTPGGSDTQVQFNDATAFGGDAGLTYSKTTDTLTVGGALVLTATGAGFWEMAEGTAPSAVGNRVTVAAPTDVQTAGWVLSLPTTPGTSGQFLQTNGSGVTTWATPSGSGTVTATAGALTLNAVVLGAGSTDTKVSTGITTDGAATLNVGETGALVGDVRFFNLTSGRVRLVPVTGALGTSDLVLPARSATIATTTGTLTSGRCVEIDASGNFIQAAAACSSGGGTINAGATNTIPRYTASTTLDDSLLSDDGTTLVYTGSGGLSLTAGFVQLTEATPPSIVANTVQHAVVADVPAAGTQYLWGAAAGTGILRVANSSGVMTVTQDAGVSHLASSTSADLRSVLSDESGTGAALFAGGNIGAGTATTASANDNTTLIATTAYVQGELTAYASDTKTLTNTTYDTEGTGNAFTSTGKAFIPAGGCQGTTAFSNWDLPAATPAVAACVTGTVVIKGVLDFADTSGGFSAQNTIKLPSDFTGTIDAAIQWTTTATSGNVEWSVSTICTATDGTETDDPGAFNTASTVVTAAPGVANRVQTSAITSLTITGCAAGELMHVRVFRDGNDAQDTLSATVRLIGVELTIRRAQ